MSTRGKVVVVTQNGYKYGFFNRSDSYPSGLGNECLSWIKKNKRKFKDISNKLELIKWIISSPDGEIPESEVKRLQDAGFDWLTEESYFTEAMDSLTRKKPEFCFASNDINFNGIFCEYTYTIDLKNKVFVADNQTFSFTDLPKEFK